MKEFLSKLFRGEDLSCEEAKQATSAMILGKASAEQMAGYLGALAAKGETVAEIVGSVLAMREQAIAVKPQRQDLIDVCGTGGDGAETFNISTCSALLLAAAQIGVCKHGNRAVSSRCGSADVLEALGIPIDLNPVQAATAIDQLGFAFLFAPQYHPAMQNVGSVRRSLAVRTIFNLLGPLANPAPVRHQVLGVFQESLLRPMASALQNLGTEHALLVFGHNGLDELSLSGPSLAVRIQGSKVEALQLVPEDFGLARASLQDLKGGDKQINAAIIENILRGERGPRRDVVLMNAAAALLVMGRVQSWRDGVVLAENMIDQGQAIQALEKLRKMR